MSPIEVLKVQTDRTPGNSNVIDISRVTRRGKDDFIRPISFFSDSRTGQTVRPMDGFSCLMAQSPQDVPFGG